MDNQVGIDSVTLLETAPLWKAFSLSDEPPSSRFSSRLVLTKIEGERFFLDSVSSRLEETIKKKHLYFKLLKTLYGEEQAAYRVTHCSLYTEGRAAAKYDHHALSFRFEVPSVMANLIEWVVAKYSNEAFTAKVKMSFDKDPQIESEGNVFLQERGEITGVCLVLQMRETLSETINNLPKGDMLSGIEDPPQELLSTGQILLAANELLDRTDFVFENKGVLYPIDSLAEFDLFSPDQKAAFKNSRPFLELLEVVKNDTPYYRIGVNLRSPLGSGYDEFHSKVSGYATFYPIRDVSVEELKKRNLTPFKYLLIWQSIFALMVGDSLKSFECAEKFFSESSDPTAFYKWNSSVLKVEQIRHIEEALSLISVSDLALIVDSFDNDGSKSETFDDKEKLAQFNRLLAPLHLLVPPTNSAADPVSE